MSIRQRSFGAPPLYVSELALGTWGLSGEGYGPVSDETADATIKRAVELGVTVFDTSDAYGKGAMEERLGRLLEPHVATTYVVTRQGVDRSQEPARKRFDPAYLDAALVRSRERLRRECVDFYFLHNPSAETLANEELRAFLRELKEGGRVRAWGASVGDAAAGRAALEAGAQAIAIAYNALFANELHGLADLVAEKKVGVFAHSVLGYGLLAGMWAAGKTFNEGDHRRDRWTGRDLRSRQHHLGAMRSLLGGEVLTLRAAALRYVLSNERVSAAVLGPRNVSQLEQLVREAGAAPPYLDAERLGRLPQRLRELGQP
ncbi:MAG: aldo/keto reductase [Polyangiaceae bacterium]|jgi:aryl-alcohol dehydrogenase-like predicted oxidoreductase|nr:aldo/keto reductase [Polyangiaceae bacterium]